MSKKYVTLDDLIKLIDSISCDVCEPVNPTVYGGAAWKCGITKHRLLEGISHLAGKTRFDSLQDKSAQEMAKFLYRYNISCECCRYFDHRCDFDHVPEAKDCIEGIRLWLEEEGEIDLS